MAYSFKILHISKYKINKKIDDMKKYINTQHFP